MKKEFTVFADYHQVVLKDASSEFDESRFEFTKEDNEKKVAVSDKTITIFTARNMDVPITVEMLDSKPNDENLDKWDHVVEGSLKINSGKFLVTDLGEQVEDGYLFEVKPGKYRIRVYYEKLDSLSANGLEGENHYPVEELVAYYDFSEKQIQLLLGVYKRKTLILTNFYQYKYNKTTCKI